jgi:hypothetical protein
MGVRGSMTDGGALTLNDFSGIGEADPRRREDRVTCHKTVTLLPCVADEVWQFRRALLIDCSPHGIGIVTSSPMQAGQQFLLKLKLDKLMLVIYTVKHCRASTPRRYQIGAEFHGFVQTGEMKDPQTLLEALLAAQDASDE